MEIGLVLGGGGARGFAHIGVLRSLAERDIMPVAIAGCSMGGIVGALAAAGHDHRAIGRIVTEIQPWKLLDIGRMGSLIGGRGMAHQMDKYLPDDFSDLDIPLAVTAVDIQAGRLVIFRDGPLRPAIRGTSSLPGVISPEYHEGRYLIDGGLLNNLPVDVIRTMTRAPVLAVDVASPPNREIPLESSALEKARGIIKGDFRPLTFELFMKAFDVPAARLTETRLALNPPDVLIRPELEPNLKTEDFNRYEEAIEAGYAAANAALERGLDGLKSPDEVV